MHFTEKFALVAYVNKRICVAYVTCSSCATYMRCVRHVPVTRVVHALRASLSRVVRRTRVAYVTVPSRPTHGRRNRHCPVPPDVWASWSLLYRHARRVDVMIVAAPSRMTHGRSVCHYPVMYALRTSLFHCRRAVYLLQDSFAILVQGLRYVVTHTASYSTPRRGVSNALIKNICVLWRHSVYNTHTFTDLLSDVVQTVERCKT